MYLKIKVKYKILTIFLSIGYYSNGQFLHTPEEMEKIVLNAPDKYILQETDNLGAEAFANCRQSNINTATNNKSKNFYPDDQQLSKSESKSLKKRNKKIKKRLTREKAPDLTEELFTNLYRLGNFQEALQISSELFDTSAFKFENEFFLALAHFKTGDAKLALNHIFNAKILICLLYTSPSPRDQRGSRMPSSA